jgi:hypothetical protein
MTRSFSDKKEPDIVDLEKPSQTGAACRGRI